MLCLKYSSIFLIICIVNTKIMSAKFTKLNSQYRPNKMVHDLPAGKDLLKYLNTIEAIVDFCVDNKDEININIAFGLFLTNVNLEKALQAKSSIVPINVRSKIKNILYTNDKLLQYFRHSAIRDTDVAFKKKYRIELDILSLFNDTSLWVNRLEKFTYTEEMSKLSQNLEEIYSPWNQYLKKVDRLNDWVPNPESSDTCLSSLSRNPINRTKFPQQCSIAEFCYDILKTGTNFGYSLSHRIVLLLMAHFGRGCTVFSYEEDKEMLQRFCSMGHTEAECIAKNNYGAADLFMEIISLCAVDGHSEFLNQTWMNSMLHFQTNDGCFGANPVKKRNLIGRSFKVKKDKSKNISQDGCSGHMTGLAAAAFSAAVRLIIEENNK